MHAFIQLLNKQLTADNMPGSREILSDIWKVVTFSILPLFISTLFLDQNISGLRGCARMENYRTNIHNNSLLILPDYIITHDMFNDIKYYFQLVVLH